MTEEQKNPQEGSEEDMQFQDRRQHRRVTVEFPVEYRSQKLFQFKHGKNLSAGGLFIETKALEPAGTKINLILSFPDSDEKLEAEGVVAWSNPAPLMVNNKQIQGGGMGIMFTKLPAYVKKRIEEVIDKEAKGSAKKG